MSTLIGHQNGSVVDCSVESPEGSMLQNCVFAGCRVWHGRGFGVAIGIGPNTVLSKLIRSQAWPPKA